MPGVGQKVVGIMFNFVFDEPNIAGNTRLLCVLDRLGVIDTTSASKAADTINAETPPRFQRHAHEWLIPHGMKACVSRLPRHDDFRSTGHRDWFAGHGAGWKPTRCR